ncbi:MAG TPA: saccharopine dehydrogenase NADP-binding domain-containing protein [Solirubrobacteraceae bacterium]
MSADRPHDVVLLGATGFTGGLTAEYLAAHAGDTRWAIAGRNRDKLARVAERIGADVPTVVADSADPGSLRELAESARVVITTVGPYISYGEPLVAACAAAGTDYVDLTGEPEFVDLMYVRHHAAAEASGARIVHACGFDSIPHDLGAQFTVEHLPEDVPLKVEGYVRAGGKPSGGTLASALGAFSRMRQWRRVAAERKRLEPRPSDRKISGVKGAPHRVEGLGWALPMPTIDPQIVLRSARALPRYGPDFSYGHYVAVKRLPVAVGLAGGTMGLIGVSQIPQVRKLLTDKFPSGQGPSEEERAKSWFKVRFLGEGGGAHVACEVSGGDPGYGETAKMLAESALCLAHDDLPAVSGQVTTAQAMGPVLRERLQRAGLDFSVVG